MKIKLEKDYVMNGILKKAGTTMEVTNKFAKELKKSGYLDVRKKVNIHKTVIEKE